MTAASAMMTMTMSWPCSIPAEWRRQRRRQQQPPEVYYMGGPGNESRQKKESEIINHSHEADKKPANLQQKSHTGQGRWQKVDPIYICHLH